VFVISITVIETIGIEETLNNEFKILNGLNKFVSGGSGKKL
jgi:hypothetical protein